MLHIVLCAYNEEKAIGRIWQEIISLNRQIPTSVTLVNDGSKDQTGTLAKQYLHGTPALEIIDHAYNQGLGRSVREGFENILERLHNEDTVATLDGDGTHPPALLKTMQETLIQAKADVVIASRYSGKTAGEEGVPAVRRWCGKLARRLFSRRFRNLAHLKDTTTSFRCYRADALRTLFTDSGKLRLKQNGFSIQLAVLIELANQGKKIVEIPFYMKYQLKQSKSGFRYGEALREYIPLLICGPHHVS